MSILRAIDLVLFEHHSARRVAKGIYLGEAEYDGFKLEIGPILSYPHPCTPDSVPTYRGINVYQVNTKHHLAVN